MLLFLPIRPPIRIYMNYIIFNHRLNPFFNIWIIYHYIYKYMYMGNNCYYIIPLME